MSKVAKFLPRIGKDRLKQEAREWGEAIVIALILTLILRTFVIQAFMIPSSSMYPTLMKGDKLFVNKFIYKFREPERWEIIVFKFPEDTKKDYIKRLVAFENELVEIRNGGLYIDGVLHDPPDEILNNTYYNQGPYGSEGRPVRVPEGHYYVLGDNNISSKDSRFWGFVPEDYMVGKAFVRWWPLHRMGKLDRVFER